MIEQKDEKSTVIEFNYKNLRENDSNQLTLGGKKNHLIDL